MKKTSIELLQADITTLAVDAIVNAANSTLLGGGGVDGAIHRASGPKLREFCSSLGGCSTGEAKITPGFNLPAKFIIHTVGPVWQGGRNNERTLLRNCYWNSLSLALKHNLRSVAFPAISTGAYRFPKEEAARIALTTTKDFLTVNADFFQRIIFVLFSQEDLQLYQRLFREIFE
ncbi:MAG: O-acetyl-ADP-ribose deacetylase [Candidatus Omnitrophica bacterium]|nr:O-acetyl-ADP-ribose deacetylase [Candidatus Omnitrophota bacterium]